MHSWASQLRLAVTCVSNRNTHVVRAPDDRLRQSYFSGTYMLVLEAMGIVVAAITSAEQAL